MSKLSEVSIRMLRRLLRCLEKHHRSSTSAARTLHGLPAEILTRISGYLPSENSAALSSTCQRCYLILKPSHGWNAHLSSDEKLGLLQLIVLNLADCIACPECLRIHHNKNISHYGIQTATLNSIGQLPSCIRKDDDDQARLPSLFSTTVFRMVMKKHYFEPTSTDLLDSIAVKGFTTFQPGDVIRYGKSKYKIVHGNLFYRSIAISVPRWRYDSVRQDVSFFNERSRAKNTFCPHINVYNAERLDMTSQIQGCQRCRTEFRVSSIICEGHGVAIVDECWRNYGTSPQSTAYIDHFPAKSKDKCDSGETRSPHLESSYLVRSPSIASVFGDTNYTKSDQWISQAELLAIFRSRTAIRDPEV